MKYPKFNFNESYKESIFFLKSTDFTKAIILAFGIIVPIAVGVYVGYFEVGLALALGALLSSPSDVTGSFRNKNFGILLSALFAVFASLIGGFLNPSAWLTIPVLGIIMFIFSYFSVYGFRASLISFSGLFALVLSFANISDVLEFYERAFFIGLGGIWYLFLTVIWHRINPKAQTEQFLSQGLDLISQYLDVRGNLLDASSNRLALQKKMLELQADLNGNHETLRDILISSRKSSGSSNYERKRLLIFIHLIDILELAMANPVDYEKMDEILSKHPYKMQLFQTLTFEMAARMRHISESLLQSKGLNNNNTLEECLQKIRKHIEDVAPAEEKGSLESSILLKNLYVYQYRQVEKIRKVEHILSNKDFKDLSFVKNIDVQRFISHQEYDLNILSENFSLKSAIFKHSLRLALVVMVGFTVGAYFSLQNAYWILLTIVVIMRPNYGLTRQRSKQRILGTLIGGAIAAGIVLLIQDTTVYAILAILSLIMAFSMVQRNYKTSATFITLSVVFIYALLKPDILNVIQYRIIDTIIGAGLAALGNAILWPSWEYFSINSVIGESLKANKEYLFAIQKYYQEKGAVPTTYKLARKAAFLASGNLNTAFQRMTQEPKSKQLHLDKFYEVVVLNHTFLSSLASLGTYIQNHPTTEASIYFNSYVDGILHNLKVANGLISEKSYAKILDSNNRIEAQHYFEHRIESLNKLTEIEEGYKVSTVKGGTDELQEVQLLSSQLKWLHALSEKIIKKICISV
ncbi:putative membrane protein (TIGR01666 family) [Gillisia sp. Hel_I_86]|uniref:FUSC family protein n=1 Tax=Gillisia sp. Hel_I_86 TaxID=1249981 RepID=UPI00119BAFE1|nr:FUSC family membrane protein [Gillisia sp. Hel_I_86]TVZ28460.1 putative membrane protein (TIGR01666 family) [Gillisia sp. Hel_I_86]